MFCLPFVLSHFTDGLEASRLIRSSSFSVPTVSPNNPGRLLPAGNHTNVNQMTPLVPLRSVMSTTATTTTTEADADLNAILSSTSNDSSHTNSSNISPHTTPSPLLPVRHVTDPQLPFQPYIAALTANAMRGDAERTAAAGMNQHLAKPVAIQALRDACTKAMQFINDA